MAALLGGGLDLVLVLGELILSDLVLGDLFVDGVFDNILISGVRNLKREMFMESSKRDERAREHRREERRDRAAV